MCFGEIFFSTKLDLFWAACFIVNLLLLMMMMMLLLLLLLFVWLMFSSMKFLLTAVFLLIGAVVESWFKIFWRHDPQQNDTDTNGQLAERLIFCYCSNGCWKLSAELKNAKHSEEKFIMCDVKFLSVSLQWVSIILMIILYMSFYWILSC